MEVRDAGNLLQRAGLSLPVVDSDLLTITYPNPLKLCHELRAMGETNMLRDQTRSPLPRAYMLGALAEYQARHADAEGRIPASVEFIGCTAWAPDASQPQPARRGSGSVSLREVLE